MEKVITIELLIKSMSIQFLLVTYLNFKCPLDFEKELKYTMIFCVDLFNKSTN